MFDSYEAYVERMDEESGAYAERCKETLLAELRADHFDPHADEWFDVEREEVEVLDTEVFTPEPSPWDVVLAPLAEPPF